MRVEPRLDEVLNGERGMLKGIELCLERECLVSAVTLLFSAVDALSALTRATTQGKTDSEVFKSWCDRYLQPSANIRCSATDLYAARCGVLHLYSAESDLASRGIACRLVYQWRAGPRADAKVALPKDALVVEVESLFQVFKRGAHQFMIDSETDPEVRTRVQHHLRTMLCYEPFPTLSATVAV